VIATAALCLVVLADEKIVFAAQVWNTESIPFHQMRHIKPHILLAKSGNESRELRNLYQHTLGCQFFIFDIFDDEYSTCIARDDIAVSEAYVMERFGAHGVLGKAGVLHALYHGMTDLIIANIVLFDKSPNTLEKLLNTIERKSNTNSTSLFLFVHHDYPLQLPPRLHDLRPPSQQKDSPFFRLNPALWTKEPRSRGNRYGTIASFSARSSTTVSKDITQAKNHRSDEGVSTSSTAQTLETTQTNLDKLAKAFLDAGMSKDDSIYFEELSTLTNDLKLALQEQILYFGL
jgi:hypothetical protein